MEWVHKDVMFCLEYEHEVECSRDIPSGIPSENEPCPKGYTRNTANAADTGAEYATQIQGLIPNLYDSSHCLPI